MKIRRTYIKSFDGISAKKTLVYYDMPVLINLEGDFKEINRLVDTLYNSDKGKDLSQLNELDITDEQFVDMAKRMYGGTSLLNNDFVITGDEFYAPKIVKGVVSGVVSHQTDAFGSQVFNGDGTVTVAEVLDGLSKLRPDISGKRTSLDNISVPNDYFNDGYNICCWGYSSPFFNMYRRDELLNPITRIELAYILVVCSKLFGSLFAYEDWCGTSFNWLEPFSSIKSFKDWESLRVSLIENDKIVEFDMKKYMSGRTVSEFLRDIKCGKAAIPLPMLMSLVELGVQGLFYFENENLAPLRQVSRGELCYLFVKLSENKRKAVS